MHYKLLSDKDMKQIDALIESHGGAAAINRKIEEMRRYETRKKIAAEKGFGDMLDKAEAYAKEFPKVEDFIAQEGIKTDKKGICTTQVSGFQGSYVTLDCMRRIAENKDVLFPTEMISVVALTDHYVYSGDLLATLAMSENIIGASKFCSTNLIGIPLPEERFARIEAVGPYINALIDPGHVVGEIVPSGTWRIFSPRRAASWRRIERGGLGATCTTVVSPGKTGQFSFACPQTVTT